MKVYISASTQDKNVGYGEYGTEQKRMNELADIVADLLKDNGFEVYKNKIGMTLQQTVTESNSLNPDIHVALHSNASNGKSRGCEVWYYDGSTEGRYLAQCLYNELSPLTPVSDRGIKATKSFYELSHTKCPSALIEVSFHDNPEDSKWILANMESIAEAIVKGICKYAGKTYCENSIYRVEVGDWHDRGQAENAMKQIVKLGFPAWLKNIKEGE